MVQSQLWAYFGEHPGGLSDASGSAEGCAAPLVWVLEFTAFLNRGSEVWEPFVVEHACALQRDANVLAALGYRTNRESEALGASALTRRRPGRASIGHARQQPQETRCCSSGTWLRRTARPCSCWKLRARPATWPSAPAALPFSPAPARPLVRSYLTNSSPLPSHATQNHRRVWHRG